MGNNIKMDLKGIGYDVSQWVHLSKGRDLVDTSEHEN